jgi:uncharacterized repeat protein (TIGR03803 family)
MEPLTPFPSEDYCGLRNVKAYNWSLSKLNRGNRTTYAVFMLCAMTAITLPAQTLTTLFTFDGTDGEVPVGPLTQGTDGNLYGTTSAGGVHDSGTVFKITLSGTLTTLYSFCSQSGCPDGATPYAGLVQATGGDFYGTTYEGGANRRGTVFKITPGGTLTTLYSFCSEGEELCTDGSNPDTGLVEATNGDFYGTTYYGGVSGKGTVFRITALGTLKTLYSFCAKSGCTDGEHPSAGLVQAANDEFYGTTGIGGAHADGTVFKITSSGTLTTLYSFCSQTGCTDGAIPYAGPIQAANGDFYGTTFDGGAADACVYAGGCGTVFKITPTGTLTTLYSFCSQSGCLDGESPSAPLVQATNGDFYGTTYEAGSGCAALYYGCGTAFKITSSGTLTTLHRFCSQGGSLCTDGASPYAALLQATDGNLYGTTRAGGSMGYGVLFSLSVGLGPFVKTLPNAGEVGAVIRILGTDLTGATSVTFNGTPAAITFVSPSEIVTTVPAGATTGEVQVTTSGRTLSSNVPFQVLP